MDFNATLKPDGKLTIHRRKSMDSWLLSQAGDEEQRFIVTIEKVKKKRSHGANRYYWGVVILIIQRGLVELGHDLNKDETHEFLLSNFAYSEIVNEETGEIVRVPGKTSKMSGREFWEYIERVARFAAENLHEVIPPPNEQAQIDFENQ